METKYLNGNGVIKQRIELDVPHLDSHITYVLPLIGPNYHREVMQKIDEQKLLRPTTAQVLSLVDLALQNEGEPNCDKILSRFRNNLLWTSTENLSSKDGLFVYDNTDGKMLQTSQELSSLYDAKDARVRYVKPGFKTGFMPLSEYLEHPVILAHAGKKMMPIVERIANKLNPSGGYIFVIDRADTDTRRLSAIRSNWYGEGLTLVADRYDDDNGYASGVFVPGEARTKELNSHNTKRIGEYIDVEVSEERI